MEEQDHLMEDHDDMRNIARLASIDLSPNIELRGVRVCESALVIDGNVNIYNKVDDSNMYSIIPTMGFDQNVKG